MGMQSDGSMVSFNLYNAPLFVTHPDRLTWHAFLQDLGNELGHRTDIDWIMYGSQSMINVLHLPEKSQDQKSLIVTDAPELGNIPNRKSFIEELLKVFRAHSGRKNNTRPDHSICIIDDLWELITHLKRSEGRMLLKVIRESNGTSLHLILGSSPGHRMLMQQIFNNRDTVTSPKWSRQTSPLETQGSGSEIILGTEGLIFSSSPGGTHWEKWYSPAHWHLLLSLNNASENENNPEIPKEGISRIPDNPQEEDVQIFVIE
jgi:hypothetical protein